MHEATNNLRLASELVSAAVLLLEQAMLDRRPSKNWPAETKERVDHEVSALRDARLGLLRAYHIAKPADVMATLESLLTA